MKLIFNLSLILFLGIYMSCSEDTIEKEYKIDPDLGFSTGPGINEKIPEFSLPDQNGNLKSCNVVIKFQACNDTSCMMPEELQLQFPLLITKTIR